MRRFENANQVKQFLKEKGYTEKIRVKRINSPFTGNVLFSVAIIDLNPGGVLVSTHSHEGTTWGSVNGDGAEAARKLNYLTGLLRGTNALAVAR